MVNVFNREISANRIKNFYRVHCNRNCEVGCRVKEYCNEIIEAINKTGIAKFIKSNCSCCFNYEFCNRTQEQIEGCYAHIFSQFDKSDKLDIVSRERTIKSEID